MSKNKKDVKSQEKLTLDNLKSGMKISDSTKNPQEWEVDDDLIEQMRKYEQESNKNAIWKNKITGMFLLYKWMEENPQEKPKKVKDVIEESLEQEIEAEVQSEEDMLLDAMEDYKSKYNVKSVRADSQKFKQFFYKWKQSE